MKKTDHDRTINGCAEVIFLGFLAWWLAWINADYLYMTQELSLFLPTRLFVEQLWQQPGFLLTYGAKFLTQFFYYPWLGTVLFLLLVLLLQTLLVRCCHLRRKERTLTFIPVAALVAGALALGYMLYHNREPEVLFKQILGVLIAFSMLRLFQIAGKFRWFIFGVMVAVGYPLAGAYALIGGLLCVLESIIWKTLVGMLWIGTIPWIFYTWVYIHTPSNTLYTMGFPVIFLQGKAVVSYIGWFVLGISILLLWGYGRISRKNIPLPSWVIAVISFGLGIWLVAEISWRDENFHRELAMYRVIDRRDWKAMPEIYRSTRGEPTRFMVLAKNLGYYRLGVAGEQMFSVPDGTNPANAPFQVGLEQLGGDMFYYHYGMPNYAYRWAMEKMVKWGVRINDLKLMAKCALLQGQNELARKYLKTLEATFFHRSWAKYYFEFAEGRKPLEKDIEFRSILPLCSGRNFLDNDGRNIERYLLDQLTFLDIPVPEAIEVSLLANLIEKNKLKTLLRFRAYAAIHPHLPRHYQEAALLFAFLNNEEPDITRIDLAILQGFRAFVELWKQCGEHPGEKEEPRFRKEFGGTYWYYYLFGPTLRVGKQNMINNPH